MCCCCLPRKFLFCALLRTGCLAVAAASLAVHGLAMCWVAAGIHVYGSMNMTVEGGEEEFANKVVT